VLFVLKIKGIFGKKIQPKSVERGSFLYIVFSLKICDETQVNYEKAGEKMVKLLLEVLCLFAIQCISHIHNAKA